MEGPPLVCRERQPGGKPVGELEVSVFAAALIIDRDGILAQKACEVVEREATAGGGAAAVFVRLPGATGFRAQAVRRAALPYVYAFALAPRDLSVDGGVLVTVRTAHAQWPAGDRMLRSLRVLTRHGMAAANDDDGAPVLPVVGPVD